MASRVAGPTTSARWTSATIVGRGASGRAATPTTAAAASSRSLDSPHSDLHDTTRLRPHHDLGLSRSFGPASTAAAGSEARGFRLCRRRGSLAPSLDEITLAIAIENFTQNFIRRNHELCHNQQIGQIITEANQSIKKQRTSRTKTVFHYQVFAQGYRVFR